VVRGEIPQRLLNVFEVLAFGIVVARCSGQGKPEMNVNFGPGRSERMQRVARRDAADLILTWGTRECERSRERFSPSRQGVGNAG